MDYEALAKQYGGVTQNTPPVDYESLAKQYGGTTTSIGDIVAGSTLGRLAIGAASPVTGAFQLGANIGDYANAKMGVQPVVGPYIAGKVAELEASKRRGMAWSGDNTDVAGLLGGGLSAGAGTANIPMATTALGKLGQNMGLGTTFGLTMPNDKPGVENNLVNGAIGAGIGAVSTPVIWAANGLRNAYVNFTGGKEGQVSNFLAKLFGNEADRNALADELKGLKSGIPNERLNIGDLVDSTKSPETIALARNAANQPGTAAQYKLQEEANRAARSGPLQAIVDAGDRGAKTRANVTGPMYEKASSEMVDMSPEIQKILGGAEIAPLANKAGIGLSQEATNASVAGREVKPSVTSGSIDPGYGLPEWSVAGPNTPDVVTPPKVRIGALHDLAQQISVAKNQLAGASDSVSIEKFSRLNEALKQLKGFMRDSSENYANADATYKFLSQVPNQAEAVKPLLDALKSPLGAERAAAFSAARKKSAEQFGYENLDKIVSPTQKGWLDNVQASLDREAKAARLAMPQQALPSVSSLGQALIEQSPSFISKGYTAVKRIAELASKGMTKDAMAEISQLTLDPAGMADVLRRLSPQEVMTVKRALLDYARAHPVTPILNNMIQTNSRSSNALAPQEQ